VPIKHVHVAAQASWRGYRSLERLARIHGHTRGSGARIHQPALERAQALFAKRIRDPAKRAAAAARASPLIRPAQALLAGCSHRGDI